MTEADPITRHAIQQPSVTTKKRRYQVFEAIVDTAETITLDIGTLADCAVFKLSDGTEITATVATNQITITQPTTTDEHVVGIAVGTT